MASRFASNLTLLALAAIGVEEGAHHLARVVPYVVGRVGLGIGCATTAGTAIA
jgi:hypothetical protein